MTTANINRVAFLGDYMPRQCGIATFTTDICEAVAAEFPECDCLVGAVNDRPEGYDYPARIRFEIDEKELDWRWFEPSATYDNAKLSHAMILCGYWTSRGDVLEAGLQSLRWLVETQTAEAGHFAPIGNRGFWTRGGERARFDQQPLEAHSMISACLEAHALTRDEYWRRAARRCFEWFLGRNDLGQSLYDSGAGGCRDALHPDRVSQNMGAESSLAFYLSLAEMTRAEILLILATSPTQRSSANESGAFDESSNALKVGSVCV